MRRGILCIFLLSVYCPFCQSQAVVTPVTYHTPASVYTQNFDGLPNTGTFTLTGKGPFNLNASPINGSALAGWQCLMTGGSTTNASFAVSTGSSTGNGVYSLGSAGNTERALGSLASSTGLYAFGIILTNTSGILLNSCTISFTTEQWRRGGSGNKNTWSFKYKTGIISSIDQNGLINETGLDMSSVVIAGSAGSLNGNLTDNQQLVSFTISSIIWKDGEQLLLRWDDADEAGNDDACGMDNFNFSAQQLSSLPTGTTLAATNISASSAVLNGSANDHFSNTAVTFEYDTSNRFLNPITVKAVPDTIYAGTGTSSVSAVINGLLNGTGYFFRIKTINGRGSTTGGALSFTTAVSLPVVSTYAVSNISLSSATLGGTLRSTGGSLILDKGIVWSITNLPSISNNKISMGNVDSNFVQPVTGLPQGTLIYTRSFATNAAGTAYGNTEIFTTQTSVITLATTAASLTNTATVNFSFKTAQNINGLTASNFNIETNGIYGASISSISGAGNNFTIAVNTGTDDGHLYLKLLNDTGLSIPIYNKPFLSTDFYTIDKTPPFISSISIPNKPMKTGDSVNVTILVKPDADIYKLITGKINGFALSAPIKKNDSLYTSYFKVVNGGNDINGAENIPVTITLVDSVGNISSSFQSPIIQPSDAIDANNPFITTLTIPANGLYKAGDTLDFIFHFNEKIVLTTTGASSGISLTIGTKSRALTYSSGSNSDSLVFRYMVQQGDTDKDGIKISSPVNFNNTDIKDLAGNMAMLSFNVPSTKNILIDAVIPTISSVTVPVAAIYKTGNVLDFIVNYNKKVVVSSGDKFPYFILDIGGAFKNAVYLSGSGSTALLFRYTIQPDDMDKDGIKLISPLNLNSATIKDETGNAASLILNNIGALNKITINPVTVAVTEVSGPPAGIYKTGDTLMFSVIFNEKVFVTTSSGIPSLKLTISSSSRNAFYQNDSGNNELKFLYIIQSGELDTNGIKINATLSLNNGTIKDARGNNIPIALSNIIKTTGILVDAIAPSIKSISIPAKNIYKKGDTLAFVFRFDEKIIINSTTNPATVQFTIGDKMQSAVYTETGNYDSLLFRYIVKEGDVDKNGIQLSNSITPNDNVIKDIPGNRATLSFTTPSTKNILIDAVIPTITSVAVPIPAIYKTGNVLDFVVNYSKKVMVNMTDKSPYLILDIGGAFKNAVYLSGTGSAALLFRYTIQLDDIDKDGIKVLSPVNLNAATIKDEAGNSASLILSNIGAMSNISINPLTVALTEVTVPPAGIYKTGDTLLFSVIFNEKVFVTTSSGIPSLKLTIGSSSRNAFYQNGSGNNALDFSYIIQPGDEDSTGIKINTILSLNSSVIKDIRGNIIPTGLHNVGNVSGIFIDAVNPSIKAVITPEKNFYKANDTLDCMLQFTEKVRIKNNADTPYINLETKYATKKIMYIRGSGTDALLFRYIVQKGDKDKNGIKLDSVVVTGNSLITDIAGNSAILTLKNIGAFSGIRINAVAPSFESESSQMIVCENRAAVSIAELLVVKDEETGEPLTWQMMSGCYHGALSKTISTAFSNGNRIAPTNIFYKSDAGYNGTDSLIMQVTDGVNTSQKKIILIIQPSIKNNSIGSPQIVCKGNIPAPIAGSLPSGGDGIYALTWEQSVTNDTIGFRKAASANYLQQYVPDPLSTTTWFRRKVTSGACLDISGATKITVLKNGVWTGSFDQNWQNENNWCTAMIPDTATDVFINGNTKYNSAIKDTAKCNNLTLLNNARLSVTGSLLIKGSIVNPSGLVDATKGSLICNGLSMQIIPAGFLIDNNLQNLVINNPAGISLAGPIKISGSVILNSGSLITNDHLSLQHTASIGASAAGTTITGNIVMEHFIPAGRRAFRLLGHPFINSIGLDMIKDSIDITGSGGDVNGFTNTVTNQPSAFRYDPLLGNDSSGFDAGWTPFTNTNGQLENAWKEFAGIRLFARGKPGQGLDGTPAGDGTNGTYFPKVVLLSLSGKVHTGDQEIILPQNTFGNYHIIANPYPAAVELSSVTRGEDIGMNYWVWDPMQARIGGYSSIPFKSKNILPPFSAFIVKANGTNSNNVLFTENCKVTESATGHLPLVENDDSYFIELRLETDSIFWDRVLLLGIDSAKSIYDKTDAEKFRNSEVNFYSISRDQKMLSIDARPINNESRITLGLHTNTPGQFHIRVAKISLPGSNTLLLHDKYLDRWMKLDKDSSYPFAISVDTASMGNERFEITSPKKIMADTNTAFKIITNIMPVPATDKIIVNYLLSEKRNTTIRVIGLNGNPFKILELGIQKQGQEIIPVADIPNGLYLLEMRCGEHISTKKFIKQ